MGSNVLFINQSNRMGKKQLEVRITAKMIQFNCSHTSFSYSKYSVKVKSFSVDKRDTRSEYFRGCELIFSKLLSLYDKPQVLLITSAGQKMLIVSTKIFMTRFNMIFYTIKETVTCRKTDGNI